MTALWSWAIAIVYLAVGALTGRAWLRLRPPPAALFPAEGDEIHSAAEGFTQRIVRVEADRVWVRLTMAAGAAGPPPHVHARFAERVRVAAGRPTVELDGVERTLGPGEELLIEPGVPHRIRNGGDVRAVIEAPLEPAYALPKIFALFLAQAYGFFDASPRNGRPPRALFQMAFWSPMFDSWIAGPPVLAQRLLFTLLRPLALLLGFRPWYRSFAARSRVRAVVGAVLAAAVLPTSVAAQSAAAPLRSPLPVRIDSLVQAAGLSGSVVVTRGGETLLAAGYGLADRRHGIPNGPATKFLIGSITKQFTGMAILLLQDEGKLHVTDRVGAHLEDAPESWRHLTIHQLLTHTSGLMHSWALPGFAERAERPITLDETLALFLDQPLLYAPGTGFTYSGVGYFLLARIIEEVSGQSYDAFLRERVFEPLEMRSTGGGHPDVALEDRAHGYVRDDAGDLADAPPLFTPVLTGGGHLYSTAEDLARWNRALARHALLSPEAYAAYYRPERQSYAYGWRVAPFRGRPAIVHSGGLPGFNAHNLRLPEDGIDVVVLTNVTPGQARPVAEAIAALVLEDPRH